MTAEHFSQKKYTKPSHILFLTALILIFSVGAQLVPETSLASAPTDDKPHAVPLKIITKTDEGTPLNYPSQVLYEPSANEIYVLTGGDSRIVVYDADYFPLISVGKGRGLMASRGVYLSPDGQKFYIMQGQYDGMPARLTIMNAAFLPDKEFFLDVDRKAKNFSPSRMAIGKNGEIYLLADGKPDVLVIDNEGNFLRWFPEYKRKRSSRYKDVKKRKTTLIDIKIDSKGRIFLLSEETSHIYIYGPDEDFLFRFGNKGGSSGKTSRPRCLALDEKRQLIYVTDYMRHTVVVYDFEGNFRFEFGGRGWGPGWFNYPNSITVDEQGNVIVSELFNHRMQVLKIVIPGEMIVASEEPIDQQQQTEPTDSVYSESFNTLFDHVFKEPENITE
ncbi:MAG: NHL repeat-containing protein [Desulfobulbaceae bacterium]|nr:NHL repeat-containing protein [Desulfobulbaceae bacterium]